MVRPLGRRRSVAVALVAGGVVVVVWGVRWSRSGSCWVRTSSMGPTTTTGLEGGLRSRCKRRRLGERKGEGREKGRKPAAAGTTRRKGGLRLRLWTRLVACPPTTTLLRCLVPTVVVRFGRALRRGGGGSLALRGGGRGGGRVAAAGRAKRSDCTCWRGCAPSAQRNADAPFRCDGVAKARSVCRAVDDAAFSRSNVFMCDE